MGGSHQEGKRNTIIFYGGGRWARLLIGTALEILDREFTILVCSPRNAVGMKQWIQEKELGDRVDVCEKLTILDNRKAFAVIVVNSANDHVSAARWALENKLSVLVEKPAARTAAEIEILESLSISNKVVFAPAHIFLYADYLKTFADAVWKLGSIRRIAIEWADPKSEMRYDETKTFDTSLPVYEDLMPHMCSILDFLLPQSDLFYQSLTISRGGAKVAVSLKGQLECVLNMERNADERKRKITVETHGGPIALDFTSEPGIVSTPDGEYCVDPDWKSKPRPSAKLLSAFFQSVRELSVDSRLKTAVAKRAANLSDSIRPDYIRVQNQWLKKKLDENQNDSDVRYALAEIG